MQELLSTPIITRLGQETADAVQKCIASGCNPHLAVVLLGENPDSLRYIDRKSARAKQLGIIVSVYHFEQSEVTQLIDTLDHLGNDDEVHGIIVQLPLPQWCATPLPEILQHIPEQKDVDGLLGMWAEQMHAKGSSQTEALYSVPNVSPMVAAVTLLLSEYGYSFHDGHTVLVGNGVLVGQPLSRFLSALDASYEVVDEETKGILQKVQKADIVISGTGQDNLITYQWVQPGAVVIDASADVHRDSVDQVAAAVSPAKGGVGPVTVDWLLHNVVQAALAQS